MFELLNIFFWIIKNGNRKWPRILYVVSFKELQTRPIVTRINDFYVPVNGIEKMLFEVDLGRVIIIIIFGFTSILHAVMRWTVFRKLTSNSRVFANSSFSQIHLYHFFPCFLWPSSTNWTWHLNCSSSTNPETLVHSLNVTKPASVQRILNQL